MSSSMYEFKSAFIGRKLSALELKVLCGALAHDKPFETILKPSQLVKPVAERRFKLGKTPSLPIFKLAKKVHVENFFDTGALQLGSFNYFNRFEHSEIGDAKEGIVTLVAKTAHGVHGGRFGTGFNMMAFCTHLGQPSLSMKRNFGYNSGFLIKDPISFSNAISESIGAKSSIFGKCLYRKHKAVLGFPGRSANPYIHSHESANIVKSAKFFIKPEKYSSQNEFRFLFEFEGDQYGSHIVLCPDARRYCKPIQESSW